MANRDIDENEIPLIGLIIEELPKLSLDAQRRVADYADRLATDNASAAKKTPLRSVR